MGTKAVNGGTNAGTTGTMTASSGAVGGTNGTMGIVEAGSF
jgi:hypothetical protein